MPAAPARRTTDARTLRTREQSSRAVLERRRRDRHFARLRRDLLEDIGAAIALTILAITLTAGLGVVALIEAPVALLVAASYRLERRIRRQRLHGSTRSARTGRL